MLTNHKVIRALPLIFICCLLVTAQSYDKKLENVKVVGVSDGDTITVLTADNQQVKIRFAGIDAPESRQDFGTRAKQALSDLVFGKTVTVIYDKTDRYGRTVGKVLLDGKDINLEMIRAGFAWHYKDYEREQPEADRQTYAEAEIEARKAIRGLWAASSTPVAPWAWRRIEREDNASGSNNSSGASPSPAVPATTRSPAAAASTSGSAGRTYIRGSRGGCYYLSSSGRKVYVDRSLCSN